MLFFICNIGENLRLLNSRKRMTIYDAILARSFSKHEQKKLGWWAFVGCLIIAVTIFAVFKPYLGAVPVLNLQLSMGASFNMLMAAKEAHQPRQPYNGMKEPRPICNLARPRSDVCEANGDIRIHGNSSTILIASTQSEFFERNGSWNIKPYARKGDDIAMLRVRTVTIRTAQISDKIPQCTRNYSIPAIVFSTGGYAGNLFHDFSDVLIPLYLTSKEFNGDVQFLLTDKRSWWSDKYRKVLQRLSRYELIDIDNEGEVLCFPRIIVGLKANKEFSIDTSKSSSSMKDFTRFLKNTYALKRQTAINLSNNTAAKRPRLLIISRRRTRRLLNGEEIADVARSLGFDVVIKETGGKVTLIAEFINSFDVMMGVHGAGLTNMVYLPENAVVIQIIPLGAMEWLARTDYGVPPHDMNLRYLDYRITPRESTLTQQYSYDHEILKDPGSIHQKGWRSYKSIFLDNQDVKVDVIRFTQILCKAYDLLRR